jgi:S-adenosylmethionine/arginine decarboxylase-like enzyme
MNKDQKIIKEYKKKNPWGLSTCIDLYGCNPKTLRSAKKIKQFVKDLCQLIDMKTFGQTVVVNFGEDPRVSGFSMTQLIETSLISGHFANQSNAIYLDVFSCKEYPPYKTADFAKKFFEAKKCEVKINFRY